RRKPKGGEVERAHKRSSCYYYAIRRRCARESHHFDRESHQSGDERETQGGVRLALGGAPAGPIQREVVGREGTNGLRHRAQALGAPDALVVALAEEAGEDAARARDLAHQAEPGQKLQERKSVV